MWFASLIFLYLSFVINLKLMKKIKILFLWSTNKNKDEED